MHPLLGAVALLGAACGSMEPTTALEDGGVPPDAAETAGRDAALPPPEPDAGVAASVDAGEAPVSDAGGVDAGLADAGEADAGASMRARVCAGATERPLALVRAEVVARAAGGRDFAFLEGPVWLADRGALLFSDLDPSGPMASDDLGPPTILYRLTPPDRFEVFVEGGRVRSNGLAVDEAGRVWAATHDHRGLSRLDPADGAREVVADRFDGRRFNTTNDLVVATDGTVYFTDPAYRGQLDGRARELDFEGVFAWVPGAGVSLVSDAIERPNGITLSPAEDSLYVADREADAIWRFPRAPDGTLGPPERFAEGRDASGDGVAMDCAGHLYVAVPNRGVHVYRPDGSHVGRIPGTGPVTNVAFGGPDHRDLYITERTALKVARDWPVPGLPY